MFKKSVVICGMKIDYRFPVTKKILTEKKPIGADQLRGEKKAAKRSDCRRKQI